MQKSFSRRHGLDQATGPLLYNEIPAAFRLELFQKLQAAILDAGAIETAYTREYALYRDLCIKIHRAPAVLCGDEDDVAERYRHEHFLQLLMTASWHEVLSMIEGMVPELLAGSAVNSVFKTHRMGYRLLKNQSGRGLIVKNYYESEAPDVDSPSTAVAKQSDIKEMLEQARRDLANPTGVNAARAAALAVQAVEAYLKRWLTDCGQKAPPTLGDAIKILCRPPAGKTLEPHFLNVLEQIYIWRNRTPSVGHGGATPPVTTVSEALFVIDLACAFVNYVYRLGKPTPAATTATDTD